MSSPYLDTFPPLILRLPEAEEFSQDPVNVEKGPVLFTLVQRLLVLHRHHAGRVG